jgi:hypothetical protein
MLYMIIETFKVGAEPVYRRFQEKGRTLPDGLRYVESWVAEDKSRCYQIMSTGDRQLLDKWFEQWNDLVSFEVVPVLSSFQAQNSDSGMEPVSTPPGTC